MRCAGRASASAAPVELVLAVRRPALKGSGGAFKGRGVAVPRLIAEFHAQPKGL
jgi:hypothetical protein